MDANNLHRLKKMTRQINGGGGIGAIKNEGNNRTIKCCQGTSFCRMKLYVRRYHYMPSSMLFPSHPSLFTAVTGIKLTNRSMDEE